MIERVVDYKIISDIDIRNLETKVMEAIQKGWQPFGASYITSLDEGMFCEKYYQTMVMKEYHTRESLLELTREKMETVKIDPKEMEE